MSRYRRSEDKYNRALVRKLRRIDRKPPEAWFDNIDDLLRYLNDDEQEQING